MMNLCEYIDKLYSNQNNVQMVVCKGYSHNTSLYYNLLTKLIN